MTRRVKFIVERHPDGYICYPVGLKRGVTIVGEGDIYQQALSDAVSAVEFTLETVAEEEVFDSAFHAEELFVAEAEVRRGAEVSR